MPRSPNVFPPGIRTSDKITVGLFAKTYPVQAIKDALIRADCATIRSRDLPNHIVVYFVMMLGLFRDASQTEVLRCIYEGLRFLTGGRTEIAITGKSGISQARNRVDWTVFQELFHACAKPLAALGDKGCFYRNHRIVAIDGSQWSVPDNERNAEFGRASNGRGEGAYPMVTTTSLMECGSRAFLRSAIGGYRISEHELAKDILNALQPDMICLADRNFMGFDLFDLARSTGAKLVWRARKDFSLDVERELPDGSYLSHIYKSGSKKHSIPVRVIVYRMDKSKQSDPVILITNWLEHKEAPAQELASLYHERWEYETGMDEIKTHLGESLTMRSYSPKLIKQEWYATLMTHYAIRAVMHDAARKAGIDDDDVSFTHSVRVIRRRLPMSLNFPPSDDLPLDSE